MESAVSLVWMILTITIYEQFLVEGSCPKLPADAEARAKECLTSVGLSMDQSPDGGKSGDPDQLKEYCLDGTLHRALECVERTVKECQEENKDVGTLLTQSISIDKLRSGFDYMCENIDILLEHSECVAEQTKPITRCIGVEVKLFQSEMQSNREKGQTRDVWELSCRFMEKVFVCQETYYRQNCGEDVANVLDNFMQSVTPPACAQYSNSANQAHLSTSLVLLVSFCSMMLLTVCNVLVL